MDRMYNAFCQNTNCCASSAAATFSARIHNVDTIALVVSIFVALLAVAGLRVWQ